MYPRNSPKKNQPKNQTRRGPGKLGDVLKELFESSLVPPEYTRDAKVFTEWQNVVGADLAKKAIPRSVKGGILFVETFHSIWTVELQARSPMIISKLNEKLGAPILKEIRFRLARNQ